MVNMKEINNLFNDPLNTFYFTVIRCRTYDKNPLGERENPLPPLHGLLFPIICTISQTAQRTVVEHWVEREIAEWVHHGKEDVL